MVGIKFWPPPPTLRRNPRFTSAALSCFARNRFSPATRKIPSGFHARKHRESDDRTLVARPPREIGRWVNIWVLSSRLDQSVQMDIFLIFGHESTISKVEIYTLVS